MILHHLNASTTVDILGHRITNLLKESESEVAQSCLTLSDTMDCSLPAFSIHGIFQVRVPEWVAISFSRGSSRLRGRTRVSCTAGRRFTLRATRGAVQKDSLFSSPSPVLLVSCLFDNSPSDRSAVVSHCGFDLTSSDG